MREEKREIGREREKKGGRRGKAHEKKRGEVTRGLEGWEKAKEARNSHREIPSECDRAANLGQLRCWILFCASGVGGFRITPEKPNHLAGGIVLRANAAICTVAAYHVLLLFSHTHSLVWLILPKYKETPLWHKATEKCNLQNKSDCAECPFTWSCCNHLLSRCSLAIRHQQVWDWSESGTVLLFWLWGLGNTFPKWQTSSLKDRAALL